jgi:hypothetical protein
MDLLKLWSSNDPAGLLRLAKDIQDHGGWKAYLSREEHRVFEEAVTKGGDVWSRFINGQAICQVEVSERSARSTSHASNSLRIGESPVPRAASSTPQPGQLLAINELKGSNGMVVKTLDASALAFRVRYMLYNKAIGVLFPSKDPEVSLDIASSVFENPEMGKKVDKPTTRKLDEDYDIDEDEEDDEENNTISNESNETSNDIEMKDPTAKVILKGELASTMTVFGNFPWCLRLNCSTNDSCSVSKQS